MLKDLTKKIFSTERLHHSFGFWLAMFLFFIFLDQLTKWLALVLHWPIFKNYNFAFSLPIPWSVMFLIYVIVLIFIARYVWQTWEKSFFRTRTAWLLILAGGLSNIIERVALGYVRDFIPIATGILNVADFMIILGALLILTQRISRD